MKKLFPAICLLFLWQAIVWLDWVPSFILPGPLVIIRSLVEDRTLLFSHLVVTGEEVFLGLVIGVCLGVLFAVMMMASSFLYANLRPLLGISQAIPVFVLAPILTLWFGYGLFPKVAMTVLLVFFPVASGFLDGMKSTPSSVLDLARIAGAGRWREMLYLRMPHALPYLAASMGIAVIYAPTGAIIGEWIGASKGLGYLMLMANARSRTGLMFAALSLIVAMTLLLHRVCGWIFRCILKE